MGERSKKQKHEWIAVESVTNRELHMTTNLKFETKYMWKVNTCEISEVACQA